MAKKRHIPKLQSTQKKKLMQAQLPTPSRIWIDLDQMRRNVMLGIQASGLLIVQAKSVPMVRQLAVGGHAAAFDTCVDAIIAKQKEYTDKVSVIHEKHKDKTQETTNPNDVFAAIQFLQEYAALLDSFHQAIQPSLIAAGDMLDSCSLAIKIRMDEEKKQAAAEAAAIDLLDPSVTSDVEFTPAAPAQTDVVVPPSTTPQE